MDKITLAEIQAQVKAPKGQFNSFGKYNYRSCEDIMEAVKPVINPMGYWLTVTDQPVEIGGRVYIKATAVLTNGTDTYSVDGYAREAENKKGMDDSQVTGAASSYARKYALAGLFALDDTKDADATNNHAEAKQKAQKPHLQPETEAYSKVIAYMQENRDSLDFDAMIGNVKKKYLITEAVEAALKTQLAFE